MSALGDHLDAARAAGLPTGFYQVRPQVMRRLLGTLSDAIGATVALIGDVRTLEPRFTRQLAASFEDARDAGGGGRYHIEHQGELPTKDATGRVISFRRLDIRIFFSQQIGRRDDYLCIECKYLDSSDRSSDAEYVSEGVDRIVSGAYAKGHAFAIMVGLERVGPLDKTIANVDRRLRSVYDAKQGLGDGARWRQTHVRESQHPQAGGPHLITIVHGFWPVTRAAAA